MVSSPLTNRFDLVFSAGLFGWPFAVLFFGGAIVLGLATGFLATAADRAGWLDDRARGQQCSGAGPDNFFSDGCPTNRPDRGLSTG
jgi:uncharacterized membrane protein YraQ (UPF0718 family)